jgi:transcriptional regulator with XRE-family HTH domain
MERTSALDDVVAARIAALRAERGLTLEGLSALSGVSRAMISRIERAEASATAVLLAKLANALGVTLASLFEAADLPSAPLRRAHGTPVRRDPASGYLRRNVAPKGVTGVEIVDVTLPAGARVTYDNLVPVAIEQVVWVIEGRLTMGVGDTVTELGAGDALIMRLDEVLVFANPTDQSTRYAVVLVPFGGSR